MAPRLPSPSVLALLAALCFSTLASGPSHGVNAEDVAAGNCNFDSSKITMISFDYFAALVELYPSLQASLTRILRNSASAAKLLNIWAQKYSSLKDLNGLSLTAETEPVKFASQDLFDLFLRTSLDSALEQTTLAKKVTAQQKQALVDAWSKLSPYPTTVSTLQKLRAAKNADGTPRYKLAILSNGSDQVLRNGAKFMGFEFDAYIGSSKANAFKPDPRLYRQGLEYVATKENLLHIPGADFDAIGAKVFGYQVIWHNHNGSQKLMNLTGNPAYEPSCEMKDLPELLAILGVA